MVKKPVTTDEANEITVLAYFHSHPHSSIRAASQEIAISYSSIQRILSKHKMHAYKLNVLQALHPGDEARRIQFCEELLVKIQNKPNFLKNIIWTDESKFTREGIINAHNWHYWAQGNPHYVRESNFQIGFSFNVFCMLMDNNVCYEIYEESLTSQKYIQILRGCVENFLDELPLMTRRDSWYQMDGAPAHSSYEVDQLLTAMFNDRWIGRNGPWLWPPRSPDLTPLDFYLWGHIKSLVYSAPIQTKEQLIQRIRDAFQNLDPQQIRQATGDAVHKRLLKCLNANGGHIEHL